MLEVLSLGMLRSTERSRDEFGHAGTGWRRVKPASGRSGEPGQVDEAGVGWSGETHHNII